MPQKQQRTETLTLSPSRIKAHHPKCPKLLNHVIAGQLAHNHPKYQPAQTQPPPLPASVLVQQQQKASNIPDHNATVALRMSLNYSNAPLHSSSNNNNSELLNSNINYNNCNFNSGSGGGKKGNTAGVQTNENSVSSPDYSDLSNADRFKFTHGNHMSDLPLAADQQKTILLKIPNMSESEQLLVSGGSGTEEQRIYLHFSFT